MSHPLARLEEEEEEIDLAVSIARRRRKSENLAFLYGISPDVFTQLVEGVKISPSNLAFSSACKSRARFKSVSHELAK